MARFFKRGSAPKSAVPKGAEPETPSTPDPDKARRLSELKPDPDKISIGTSVPFVRLPEPETAFAARAARLGALSDGHPMGAYLGFLARVVRAQAAVQAALPPPAGGEAPEEVALRSEHGMPLLSNRVIDTGDFAGCLDALLGHLDLDGAPEPARVARDALAAATVEDRRDLALQVFEGALPVERMAESLYVAAALQVVLGRAAAGLDKAALKPVADGVCPCCGGAPVASLIVAWTRADKARYLACSLCGTQWNHVRIRCTACGSGEAVSYQSLDELSKDVQVETCETCQGYVKHLHQHRDPALDPIADDVASYGLDLKIAEEGFRKAGLNLLFVA